MIEELKNTQKTKSERDRVNPAFISVGFTVAWFAIGYMLMVRNTEHQAEAFPMFTYADSAWLKWGGVTMWLGFCIVALMFNFAIWWHFSRAKRNRDLAKVSLYISVYCLVGSLAFGLLGTVAKLAPSPAAYRFIRLEPKPVAFRVLSTTTQKGASNDIIHR